MLSALLLTSTTVNAEFFTCFLTWWCLQLMSQSELVVPGTSDFWAWRTPQTFLLLTLLVALITLNLMWRIYVRAEGVESGVWSSTGSDTRGIGGSFINDLLYGCVIRFVVLLTKVVSRVASCFSPHLKMWTLLGWIFWCFRQRDFDQNWLAYIVSAHEEHIDWECTYQLSTVVIC